MRGLFIGLLKLQGWVSPIAGVYYGYNLGGGSLGFVGFLAGLVAWAMYLGVAELAQSIWAIQEKLGATASQPHPPVGVSEDRSWVTKVNESNRQDQR